MNNIIISQLFRLEVLRILIVVISRRYIVITDVFVIILSSLSSSPLFLVLPLLDVTSLSHHHCHCHGSHREEYHSFHCHCHQGRSGPLPLCLLLRNFHQNKQNIKVCFLRKDEKTLETEIFSVIKSVESVGVLDFCKRFALLSFQHSTRSKNATNVLFLAYL